MPAKFRLRITRTGSATSKKHGRLSHKTVPEEGEKFVRRLKEQIETLERFPERCPLIPENEMLGTCYRHSIYGNYRTVFRIAGKTVYVLRVIHGARLDTSMFED